jgi:hypothetical protein
LSITVRTEAYWQDGRVQPIENKRPTGRGRWPSVRKFKEDQLVAIIEGEDGAINIIEGKEATPKRVNEVLLFHRNIKPESISNEAWENLPTGLQEQIEDRATQAEQAISSQWRRFSNEEALTGAFFSRMDGSFDSGGWSVKFSFVEFSKQTKETETGTDVAVILDIITAEGQRSFKTMWFQAKSAGTSVKDLNSLPRLKEQLLNAKKYCESSYALVYSPQGVQVLYSNTKRESFHEALNRCMQCHIGDTSITTLKNSLNRNKLFQIIITEHDD